MDSFSPVIFAWVCLVCLVCFSSLARPFLFCFSLSLPTMTASSESSALSFTDYADLLYISCFCSETKTASHTWLAYICLIPILLKKKKDKKSFFIPCLYCIFTALTRTSLVPQAMQEFMTKPHLKCDFLSWVGFPGKPALRCSLAFSMFVRGWEGSKGKKKLNFDTGPAMTLLSPPGISAVIMALQSCLDLAGIVRPLPSSNPQSLPAGHLGKVCDLEQKEPLQQRSSP